MKILVMQVLTVENSQNEIQEGKSQKRDQWIQQNVKQTNTGVTGVLKQERQGAEQGYILKYGPNAFKFDKTMN